MPAFGDEARHLLSIALICQLIALPGAAQGSAIRLAVIQGENETYPLGGQARDLILEVRNADGSPVPELHVGLALPTSGPGGSFVKGDNLHIVTTDAGGRAVVHGIRANREPGPWKIRVFGSRAGQEFREEIPQVNAAESAPATPELRAALPPDKPARHWARKAWIIGAAAGIGAGVLVYFLRHRHEDRVIGVILGPSVIGPPF